MPAQEVDRWMSSQQPITVWKLHLKPRPHPQLAGTPLSVSRGQAEAFYVYGADGKPWIIKKFHCGRAPETAYLQAISGVIPTHPSFRAGNERHLITGADIDRHRCPKELAIWLEGTVLMPRIDGIDWTTMADGLRSGDIIVSRETRVGLCRSLARAIRELEAATCSHRDLSGGNVYIDGQGHQISLIDWDSLFHPSLRMPPNTTGGTPGYISPFVWYAGSVDAASTWRPLSDRFALAILCTEFLVLSRGARLAGDGGIFDQEDLCRRRGPTLDAAFELLRNEFAGAVPLLERAIYTKTYDECPAPEEWIELADSALGVEALPPRLSEIAWPSEDDFASILTQRIPSSPAWPAPRLSDIPSVDFELPDLPAHPAPALPEDPFAARGGRP